MKNIIQFVPARRKKKEKADFAFAFLLHQSPSNKVLRWSLFIRQNLRLRLIWVGLAVYKFLVFWVAISLDKHVDVNMQFCFKNIYFFEIANPAQMYIHVVALIEIAHRITYIQWVCTALYCIIITYIDRLNDCLDPFDNRALPLYCC